MSGTCHLSKQMYALLAVALFSTGIQVQAESGSVSAAPTKAVIPVAPAAAVTQAGSDAANSESEWPREDASTVSGGDKTSLPDADSRNTSKRLDPHVWQNGSKHFRYKASADAKIVEADASRLHITSGDVLLEALRDCTISTPLADVAVPHKSLLYFKTRHGLEHVFVLLADGPGSIKVISAKHSIALGPGQEAALTDFFPKFQHLVGDDVGRRRTIAHPLGDDKYIVTSEFNVLHTFETLPIMMQINQSKDPLDTALKEKIIKTAAVLEYVEKAHGAYYRGGGN